MQIDSMKINIGNIPFVYAPVSSSDNPGNIPNKVPFSLEIRNGVISQEKQAVTEKALNDAYKMGSVISGQMDDFGNGKEYADEFLEYIRKSVTGIKKKKILEIGCGTGYLLSRLKQMGADCIGIEPGESAKYGRKKFGVEIIQDFFDKNSFEEQFDYIIFYGVLEHIYEIGMFLSDVKSLLNKEGVILLAVPNCVEQILNGDVSMLLCEHWSYFTEDSLKFALNSNGLFGDISVSDLGGVLFANVTVDIQQMSNQDELDRIQKKIKVDFMQFSDKFNQQKTKIIKYFQEVVDANEKIGCYVPGRIINWLSIIADAISMDREIIHFIDDNILLQGMYYPGFDNPIESLEQYLSKPTERLLIASYTYEKIITKKILDSGYKGKINTMRQLFQ